MNKTYHPSPLQLTILNCVADTILFALLPLSYVLKLNYQLSWSLLIFLLFFLFTRITSVQPKKFNNTQSILVGLLTIIFAIIIGLKTNFFISLLMICSMAIAVITQIFPISRYEDFIEKCFSDFLIPIILSFCFLFITAGFISTTFIALVIGYYGLILATELFTSVNQKSKSAKNKAMLFFICSILLILLLIPALKFQVGVVLILQILYYFLLNSKYAKYNLFRGYEVLLLIIIATRF